MKKTLTRLLILPVAAIFLAQCGTGNLEEQVTALAQYQTRLNTERDSLIRLVAMKTDTLKNGNIAYISLTEDKIELETKTKALQASLNKRTSQWRTAEASNGLLKSVVSNEKTKNDSLIKEIAKLHQKIAAIDSEINEGMKENVALNESLKKEAEHRKADSTAFANAPKPEELHKGFVNIAEIGAGLGFGDTKPDFSRRFISFDYVLGYSLNNFMTGVGTGVNFYNGGTMIPLYIDIRYHFNGKNVVPFVAGDGGMLFSLEKFGDTGMFLNPQIGISKKLHDRLKLNISTGFYIQQGPSGFRDSFVNLKGGFTF